mmetsp:Transcript_12180/g.28414  ORF Transcript_12180/g.28414 Transcript_12180/m.28414 type:complete len:159 (+) Transcript_12180:111-587(+)
MVQMAQCMLNPRPCKCVATTSQMLGFDEGEVMLDKNELVMKTVTFSPWIEGISYQHRDPQALESRSRSESIDSEHWVERLRIDECDNRSNRIRWRPLVDSAEGSPLMAARNPFQKLGSAGSSESLASGSTECGSEGVTSQAEASEAKGPVEDECTFDV